MEFALIGPLFVLLLAGVVVYGGWLWLAQSVQSVASEAARAAVALVEDGMRLGLGTGSTAVFMVQRLAQRVGGGVGHGVSP